MRRITAVAATSALLIALGALPRAARAQDPTFTDITAAAGLSGIGNCSWSFTWADFDGDQDLDLFTMGHLQRQTESRNFFFVNNGDLTFTEQTLDLGLDPTNGDCHGAGWADFDRDNDLDLLIIKGTVKDNGQNPNELLRNDGGFFVDINETAGTTFQDYRGRSANWIDWNNDGLLDIFSTGKVDGNGGEGNLLLENDGDQTFTNVSVASGIKVPTEINFAVSFADYDNDGNLDAFLCSQGWLFRSNGDGTWTDTTAAAGFVTPIDQCKSAAWLDYDNDGDQDLYLSTLVSSVTHEFWENNGDGTFTEVGALAGVAEDFAAHGAHAGDADNDGDLDIYVGLTLGGDTNPNRLYRNNGDKTFTDIAVAAGVGALTGFQTTDVGFVDFNQDGFLDITVANGESGAFQPCEGPYFLFQNDGNSNGFLAISLVGIQSNIHGIGSRITVSTSDGVSRIHDYVGNHHYISQDLVPAHFGLGTSPGATTVEIRWPSGTVDVLNNVPGNQFITVIEGETAGNLMVSTPGVSSAVPEVAYSATLSALHGTPPYSWAIVGGVLPAGLGLDAGTGEISGIATEIGFFPITVEVTDDLGATATADLLLNSLGDPLRVKTVQIADGVLNEPYSFFLEATGGTPPYTWAQVSGNLPQGISFDGATGELSGTPTNTGQFGLSFEVTDDDGTVAGKDLNITIVDAGGLQITTLGLPAGMVGAPYSQTLQATGGTPPYTWAISTGSLPDGLSLDSATGEISGTPTLAGSFPFTAEVTDDVGATDLETLEIDVTAAGDPLTITTASLLGGTEGVPYSDTLQATGGTPPYSWAIISGVLPSGLSLDPLSGEISGTPTENGSFPITVEVTDDVSDTDTAALSVDIAGGVLMITTTNLPDAVLGSPYSEFMQATGGTPPYSWAITTGTLPAGLTLDAATGEVSGTPAEMGSFPLTFEVTDDVAATDSANLGITVIDVTTELEVYTVAFPVGVEGIFYRARLEGNGGVPPYTWSINTGTLPLDLTLDGSDALISGMPNENGTFDVTWEVTDNVGASATKDLPIVINAPGPVAVRTRGLPQGTDGIVYGASLHASGGFAPYGWAIISGTLPAGVSMSPEGILAGAPTETGSFDITVEATGAQGGTATQALTLIVNADTGQTTFTDVSHPAGVDGVFSCSLGSTWGDYNNDGLIDLLIVSHVQPSSFGVNHLFENNGDGTFSSVIDQTGDLVAFTEDPHGGGFGDVDNDGDQDLFLAHGMLFGLNINSRNEYMINNGDETFTDLTVEAGVTIFPNDLDPSADSQQVTGVNWIDIDGDADLDLYLAARRDEGTRGSFLYINENGDGTSFVDTAVAAGLGNYAGDDFSSVWNDYDHDGDIDVFKCLDGILVQNNGDGTFTDVSLSVGITPVDNCRGPVWGDYDNDGDADLYVASLGSTNNALYQNQGDGTFVDVTDAAGVGDLGETQGAMFGDYDNDQDLDLVVITGTNNSQSNRLFRNDNGVFTDVGAEVGIGGQVGGKGSEGSWGDYDNDGFLDLVVTNGGGSLSICLNGPYLLFHNNGQSSNHWLKLDLVGQQSNRDGIGAKVWVTTPDALVQYTQHFGPQHLMSQDDQPIHFGLGLNTIAETIMIEWPSGVIDTLTNQAADQLITVVEGSTTNVPLDVTGVSPNEITVGTSDQLTVTGQGFLAGATANICRQVGRVVVDQITFVDSTTLVLDVTVPGTSAAGRCGVRVVNPGGESDVLPSAVTLTTSDPPPVPTAVNPNQVTQGTSDTLTISGTGFVSGATVRMCSDGRITVDQTTFVDSTTLVVDVTVAPGSGGSCPVRVRNPDGQAGLLPQAVSILP